MKKLLLASTVVLATLASGIGATETVHADSSDREYKVRYFDTEFQAESLSDTRYLQVFSYENEDGDSKILYKDPSYIREFITDTNKATISRIEAGRIAEFTRPPYQTFPVDVDSSEVTTMGWSEFVKTHQRVKGKDVKVKWYETVANPSEDNPQYQIVEFAYNKKLYRMYLTPGSLGKSNFKEDVSVKYDKTPTLHFASDDGAMTLQRQPNMNYVQPAISGTVTDK